MHQLAQKGPLPPQIVWKYFRHLILGLEYCHEKANIAHGHILPENLYIDSSGDLKISDFLIPLMMEEEIFNTMGKIMSSHYYLAPELINGDRSRMKESDVWAAGVTLYYMISGNLPFDGINLAGLFNQILKCDPNYDSYFNEEQQSLLSRMLCKIPEKRITIKNIRVCK